MLSPYKHLIGPLDLLIMLDYDLLFHYNSTSYLKYPVFYQAFTEQRMCLGTFSAPERIAKQYTSFPRGAHQSGAFFM
jgi:hypothetical protein